MILILFSSIHRRAWDSVQFDIGNLKVCGNGLSLGLFADFSFPHIIAMVFGTVTKPAPGKTALPPLVRLKVSGSKFAGFLILAACSEGKRHLTICPPQFLFSRMTIHYNGFIAFTTTNPDVAKIRFYLFTITMITSRHKQKKPMKVQPFLTGLSWALKIPKRKLVTYFLSCIIFVAKKFP
ncbi:MAG: hypothetical protein ACE5HX_04135 [bacterium]